MDDDELKARMLKAVTAQGKEVGRGSESGKQRTSPPEEAIVLGGPTVDVVYEVLDRLRKKPGRTLVLHDGKLCRIVFRNRNKTCMVEQHTRETVHFAVAERVEFVRWSNTAKCYVKVDPSKDLLDLLLARGTYPAGIPLVDRIWEMPLLTEDGDLLAAAGLYAERQVYLHTPKSLWSLQLSPPFQREDIEASVAVIKEIFQDFCVCQDSVPNLMALLFTLVLRPHIKGVVPIFVITGNQPGIGKGLLCRLVSIIAFGRDAEFSPGNTSSDELRKRLLAMALEGVVFSVLDNVESKLWSSDLAAWLTAPVFRDRKLGESMTVVCENTMTFVATGNHIQLGGDLARRAVLIELDSDHPAPAERDDFAHKDIVAHVREKQAAILQAIYIIAAAWIQNGRPILADAPRMGSFESWAEVMSGLLSTAGISGFLNNRHRLRAHDTDAEEMSLMLVRAREAFGYGEFSARDLAGVLAPDDVPSRVSRSGEPSMTKSLGHLFKRIAGRPYGPEALTLRRLDKQVNHRWVYKVEAFKERKAA